MQELIQYQQEEIEGPLSVLREGKPAVLLVAESDMKSRRRISHPRIVVTPLRTGEICVSLESFGCEIAMPMDLKAQWLIKMGLTKRAAEMLISEIQSTLFDVRRR